MAFVDKILDQVDLTGNRSFFKMAVLGLAAYGAYRVARTSYKSAKGIVKYCILPRVDMAQRYGKDSWALVTGASDGIGK